MTPEPSHFEERFWSAVLGGVVTLILKYFLDLWTEWVRRPNLKIEYKDRDPGYRVFTNAQIKEVIDEREQTVGYKAMYVSVSVVNERRQTAQNCRGFLVGIDIVEDGCFYATDYCDSIPLSWAYRSDEEALKGIDIPKGVVQFLNIFVCTQAEIGSGFQPRTVPPTLRYAAITRFTQPGEFRFRIQVSGDHLETKLFGLRAKWKENWANTFDENKLIVMQDTTVWDNGALLT